MKALYKVRAATIECVNAQARVQHGLTQLRVRGLTKVRCVALWVALAHNLTLLVTRPPSACPVVAAGGRNRPPGCLPGRPRAARYRPTRRPACARIAPATRHIPPDQHQVALVPVVSQTLRIDGQSLSHGLAELLLEILSLPYRTCVRGHETCRPWYAAPC